MYRLAIVTFLDILGFKEIVADLKPDQINQILKIVEESTTSNDSIRDSLSSNTIVFSDSIIRVRVIESKENLAYPIGLVFSELLELVHIQGELITEEILIRGGITLGDICVDENRVFGPGMVRAYQLESQLAKFPRIVLDPTLIKEYKLNKLLRSEDHSLATDSEYVKELIRQSDDGLCFVDYLSAIHSEFDAPEASPEYMFRHKEVILDKCPKVYDYDNKLSKYVWLANYHNTVINETRDSWFEYYDIEKEDLLIDSDELPTLQYL